MRAMAIGASALLLVAFVVCLGPTNFLRGFVPGMEAGLRAQEAAAARP